MAAVGDVVAHAVHVGKNSPVGAETAVQVKWSAETRALVPVGVVTVTSTTPALPAGAVARMAVSERTVKDEAALNNTQAVTAILTNTTNGWQVTSVPRLPGNAAVPADGRIVQ